MKKAAASEAYGAVKPLLDAVTGDILVVKKRLPAKGKRKTPTDVELHVNPFSIGVGLVGVGLALWLTQMRVGVTQQPYGVWQWPDGTKASGEIFVETSSTIPAPAPKRIKADAPPAPVRSDYDNDWVYQATYLAWVAMNTEYAVWKYEGEKNVTALKERQGFLNGGVGTNTSSGGIGPIDSKGQFNLWKALTDPWGVFPW